MVLLVHTGERTRYICSTHTVCYLKMHLLACRSPEEKQSPPMITEEKKKEKMKKGEREEEGSPVEEELASSKGSVASRTSSKASTVSTAASMASKAANEAKASSKALSATSKTSKQSLAASQEQGLFHAPSKPAEPSQQKPNVEHIEEPQGRRTMHAQIRRHTTGSEKLNCHLQIESQCSCYQITICCDSNL